MKTEEPASKGAIVNDPELSAMNAIAKRLNALDEPARMRVMSWLTDKYHVANKPVCNHPPLG